MCVCVRCVVKSSCVCVCVCVSVVIEMDTANDKGERKNDTPNAAMDSG